MTDRQVVEVVRSLADCQAALRRDASRGGEVIESGPYDEDAFLDLDSSSRGSATRSRSATNGNSASQSGGFGGEGSP